MPFCRKAEINKERVAGCPKDSSSLKIMFEITNYRPTAGEDLATLLLGDDSVARNYVLIAK